MTESSGRKPDPNYSEFAELTWIPVYARRAGQGAVSEEHPLAIRGAFKKPFTGRADVMLTLGFRFWSGEHFGQSQDLERQSQIHPGRPDAEPYRMAGAGANSAGR